MNVDEMADVLQLYLLRVGLPVVGVSINKSPSKAIGKMKINPDVFDVDPYAAELQFTGEYQKPGPERYGEPSSDPPQVILLCGPSQRNRILDIMTPRDESDVLKKLYKFIPVARAKANTMSPSIESKVDEILKLLKRKFP